MNLKKRGLGRGLEALLADDSANEGQHQPDQEITSGVKPGLQLSLK